MRPGQFVQSKLLGMILNGSWKPGSTLPGERDLAQQIGVTRPTLRETLKRMDGEGWVRIRHGKPTVVNDYLQDGGLGLLGSMTRYGDFLPHGFIGHLLEIRALLMPAAAQKAAFQFPDQLSACLTGCQDLEDSAEAFREFDWSLQIRMAALSGNPVFRMILNDFSPIFAKAATDYFYSANNRNESGRYYQQLRQAIERDPEIVKSVVQEAMQYSVKSWERITKEKNNERQ